MSHSTTKFTEDLTSKFGYSTSFMDVQHGQQWDSVRFNASMVKGGIYRLFSVPIGSIDVLTGLHKSLIDTSMTKPCGLPAPEAFSLQRVVFTFSAECSNKDVTTFVEQCVFSLTIGQKFYLRCPLVLLVTEHKCPICEKPYFGNSGCPRCSDGLPHWSVNIGGEIPGRQYVMDLAISIVIGCMATFYVDLHCDEGLTIQKPLRLWCHLEGLHARGVY